MFTGIIHEKSRVTSAVSSTSGLTLGIAPIKNWKVKKGDSISINGVCSTVVKTSPAIIFEYMPETLKKTNVGGIRKGEVVNVEQSLKLQDRLDGHLVLGHVDTIGTIAGITPEGNSSIFSITLPNGDRDLHKLIAPKGSVTIDGISLTVVKAKKNTFTVHIIPYTIEHTNLHQKRPGDTVNIEFDVVAKYVQSLLKK